MNRRAMSQPLIRRLPTLLGAALLAATVTLSACGSAAPVEAPPLQGAKIGGPFTLVGKDGKDVRWSDFDGKYRIVYFGFTFCPDACPMDVSAMMQGLHRFAENEPELAAQVQPLFVSIDPERDTPAKVGEFAAAFSPRLVGLTGSAQQVEQAAKGFVAYYAKVQESADGYMMDHSRVAYLMGRKGEPIAMLPVDQGADAVAAELAKWVR
jgi:protein SCO1